VTRESLRTLFLDVPQLVLYGIRHVQRPMGSVGLLPGVMMVLAKSVRFFEEEHLGVIIPGHVLALQRGCSSYSIWYLGSPFLLRATLNRNFLFVGPLLMSYTLPGAVLRASNDEERMEKLSHLMHLNEQFNLV
jgi:hypothetical protein